MRIIKSVTGAITAIVGEMLNIETSSLQFIDGIPIAEPINGYPVVVDGCMTSVIRAVSGYIYIPYWMDPDDFGQTLITALDNITAIGDLTSYHTVRHSSVTNVKIRSSQRLTKSTAKNHGRQRNGRPVISENVLRSFVHCMTSDSRLCRFTWCVSHIRDFDFDIDSRHVDDAISRFVCSIFYDADDVCVLEHNAQTFEFSKALLRASAILVNESVALFTHGHPLMLELSDFWRTAGLSDITKEFIRDIDVSCVFSRDFDDLRFRQDTDELTCARCRSRIWGDFYALAGIIRNPIETRCIPMCALCLHTSPAARPMETKYFRVFRVQSPRSVDDMLSEVPQPRRDILTEAINGIVRCVSDDNGVSISYTLIGNKYVAFDKIDDLLFNNVAKRFEDQGLRVCTAIIV